MSQIPSARSTMRASTPVGFLLVSLFSATAADAASQSVLLRGDGDDLILTFTPDDGGADRGITLICEPSKRKYGVVLQTAGLSRSLRIRTDGSALALGTPAAVAGTILFALEGRVGRSRFARLLGAGTVQVESGSTQLRFNLSDGADKVARFRAGCRV